MAPEFWETKTLEDMSPDEWEAVCDRCGLCCLEKFEDPDDGMVHTTSLACPFLEIGRCACLIYENREGLHPDCIRLTPQNLPQLGWLPESCSYRLLAGGRQLPPWHHLVCGDPSAVHRAGMSVKNKAVNGRFADPSDLLAAVIDAWPPKP